MAGSDPHIKPLRLFQLARQRGTQPDEKEKEHLRVCEECPLIVEVFARQFEEQSKPPHNKTRDTE